MKFLFLISISLISLLSKDIVTIYSECDYKPYSYCENGKVKGISVDIFKSIFSKIKDYSLKIHKTDWKKAMEIMKEGKKSKIKMIGTISYEPKERPFIIAYTKPFIYQNKVIFCNRKFKKKKLEWPQDFYHLRIAKMKGFARSKTLEDAVKKGLIKVIEGNSRENIFALMDKKVDCYINDEVATKGEILKLKKEFRDKNISTKKLDSIKKVLTLGKKGFHIGFSAAPFPERDDLIKKINLAIGVMQNSDEIQEIIKKNLDVYLHPNRKQKVFIALYNFENKLVSDKLDGYGAIPQIITSAFKEENINVDYKFYNYKYAYLLAKWGKKCISVPWPKTKELKTYFLFSSYINTTNIYLFYNKERHPKGIKKDLSLYKIGGVQGFYRENYFKNNKLLRYTSYDNIHDLVMALINGQVDVVPAEKSIFQTYLNKNFYNYVDEISYEKKPIIKSKDYVIFSKRCEDIKDIRQKFNKGLQIIKTNGTLKKILYKYGLEPTNFY